MKAEPFAVVTCSVEARWYGWIWEHLYISGHSTAEEALINDLHSQLNAELERREKKDSQLKFCPGKWPDIHPPGPDGQKIPSVSDIHDRIRRDAERRRLPLERRTLLEWREAFPFRLPPTDLSTDASDAELIAAVQSWAVLIAAGELETAFRRVPDARTLLPLSDFPVPQSPMSPNRLRQVLLHHGISSPAAISTDVRTASVTRYPHQDELKYGARKLACGLGREVAAIEYSILIHGQLIAKFDVFETENATLLLTLRTI